ncbi:MAG: hypothetical protein IJZ64_07785 [Ruminococcus sp.]|nr:hypothetical protein [Ruminococcus sp.]
MDKNQEYIRNLNIEDVPWHRLTTAYGRATNLPEAFKILNDMQDIDAVKSAVWDIMSIEHQSTLFYATPFATIFLTRIFNKAVENYDKSDIAKYIVSKFLICFENIAFACRYAEDYKREDDKPLANFSDMLDEKYLHPVLSDEDDYDEEDYDDYDDYDEDDYDYPDELFYSCYFYSHKALLEIKGIITKLNDESLSDGIKQILDLL